MVIHRTGEIGIERGIRRFGREYLGWREHRDEEDSYSMQSRTRQSLATQICEKLALPGVGFSTGFAMWRNIHRILT